MASVRGVVFYTFTTLSDVHAGLRGRLAFEGLSITLRDFVAQIARRHDIDVGAYDVQVRFETATKADCALAPTASLQNYSRLTIAAVSGAAAVTAADVGAAV